MVGRKVAYNVLPIDCRNVAGSFIFNWNTRCLQFTLYRQAQLCYDVTSTCFSSDFAQPIKFTKMHIMGRSLQNYLVTGLATDFVLWKHVSATCASATHLRQPLNRYGYMETRLKDATISSLSGRLRHIKKWWRTYIMDCAGDTKTQRKCTHTRVDLTLSCSWIFTILHRLQVYVSHHQTVGGAHRHLRHQLRQVVEGECCLRFLSMGPRNDQSMSIWCSKLVE